MYCTKCGKVSSDDSRFCGFCGSSLEQYSRMIAVWKFILLSVVTFGLYELYWFYKTWKFLKERNNLNISPFWRTVFSGLYAGSNAKHVLNISKTVNYQGNYSPTIIGLTYFGLNLTNSLSEPYFLLAFLGFIPLIPIVRAMNYYWQQENPNLLQKGFTAWQIILIMLGAVLVIFTILSVLYPDMYTTGNNEILRGM